jgi:uncharacterized protein YndB with AHSA1/START domain
MADLTFTRDFSVPPKEIFVFFVPQRMPLWYGTETNCRFEVQGGAADFAVGQKVRITGDLHGREMTITVVITAYEWEQLLEWEFQDIYGVRGKQRWELQASGSGARLTMTDEYTMPGRVGRFLDWLFTRRAVDMRDRMWLDHLQKLAERR